MDYFGKAVIQTHGCLEPGLPKAVVGEEVVTPIPITSNLGVLNAKIEMTLESLSKFALGQIHSLGANVEDLSPQVITFANRK